MPSSRGRPRLLFATQNEKVLSAPLKELLSFGIVASGQDLVGGETLCRSAWSPQSTRVRTSASHP